MIAGGADAHEGRQPADWVAWPKLAPEAPLHRGGLRADITTGGVVRLGDRIEAAD